MSRNKVKLPALKDIDIKRSLILNLPFLALWYFVDKLSWLFRQADSTLTAIRISFVFMNMGKAFESILPSFHPADIAAGIAAALILKAVIVYRAKNAKKFRHGVEYGSARWGTPQDIKPFIDEENEDNNILLTQTERLTMSSRPKNPKYARNKNCIIIGGSGSGKTRFFVKPQLMQMHSSYVVTDPKSQTSGILIPMNLYYRGFTGIF